MTDIILVIVSVISREAAHVLQANQLKLYS
nr:MAG TPA: hypothetical protein [Bacteriophage sp.]